MTSAPKRGRPRKSGLQEAMRAAAVQGQVEVVPAADEVAAASVSHEPAAPQRPALRANLREEDPRARAARRAQEILDHGELPGEGPDEFYIDREAIPPGWDYEWKTFTVGNKEDPAYQVQLARGGWEPVPTDRHPDFMPRGTKSPIIERKGMILMERPLEITKRVKMRDAKEARDLVRNKQEQLNASPDGQFQRDNKGQSLVKLGKSYEPMPVPE